MLFLVLSLSFSNNVGPRGRTIRREKSGDKTKSRVKNMKKEVNNEQTNGWTQTHMKK